MSFLSRLLAVALLCSAGCAAAQQPAPGSPQFLQQERERIAEQRKAVESRHAQEQSQCYQRFAVNDCLQDSRARRREELADLRRQEISLNDAERKRKGAEQTQKVEQKASLQKQEQAQRQREKAVGGQERRQQDADSQAARRQQQQDDAPANAARRASREQQRSQEEAARNAKAAQAEANAQGHARRLQEAEEYRAKRAAARAKKTKPPAQPLPPPG